MADIQLGDPVIDLANGRSMIVLEQVAGRADDWSERNDYDLTGNYGNERCGAEPSDAVFECAYVASLQSEPSKTYAFPESRLGRPAYERASAEHGRVYDLVARDVLRRLFADARTDEDCYMPEADVLDAVARDVGLGDELVDEARELADVDRIIGGGA